MTDTQTLDERKPRMEPIDDPESIKMKLAYWLVRKRMGKVITPLKTVYARFPESLGLAKELVKIEDDFSISRELQFLIQVFIATLNGCAFCQDIGRGFAEKHGVMSEKFDELLKYEESSLFSDAEKSALAYVEEASRNKQVHDDTFRKLEKHFNEEEIAQITILNAIENFYNLVNGPLNIESDELCELWADN